MPLNFIASQGGTNGTVTSVGVVLGGEFTAGRVDVESIADRLSSSGKYELIEVVGSGAGSVIFRARESALGRDVALKVKFGRRALYPSETDSEALTLAKVSQHPHIISLYETGITSDGFPFLALEFATNGRLRLDQFSSPEEFPAAREVARQLASALDAVHSAGLLHCDVKPSNVLIASDGSIRLCDFDSSKRIGDTIPTLDDLRCSLPFVAPEVLDGAKPTSGADIYSFGATIWSLLAGHDPLNLATETPVTAAVIAATNRRFSFHDLAIASASSDICSLFEQCLNPDPTLRPTAAELVAAIGTPAGLKVGNETSSHPGRNPRRLVAIGAVVLASGALLFAGGAWANSDPSQQSSSSTERTSASGSDQSIPGSLGSPAESSGQRTDGSTSSDICSRFKSSQNSIRELLVEASTSMKEATNLRVVLQSVIVDYPQRFATAVAPVIDAASTNRELADSAAELTPTLLKQLIVADGTIGITSDSPLIDAGTSQIRMADVPSHLSTAAASYEQLFQTLHSMCPDSDLDLADEKAAMGLELRDTLGGDNLQKFLSEPHLFDGLDDPTLYTLAVTQPMLVEALVVLQPDWLISLLDSRVSLQRALFRDYPDTVLHSAQLNPSILAAISVDGRWHDRFAESFAGLWPARKAALVGAFSSTLQNAGIDPNRSSDQTASDQGGLDLALSTASDS